MWQGTLLLGCLLSGSLANPATTVPEVNITDNYGGRIINGFRANPGAFPWQVSVIYDLGGQSKVCGGALISKTWVVTAAHCAKGGTNYHIGLGSIRLNGNDNTKVRRGWKRTIWDGRFNSQTLANDIAVLELNQEVELNQYVQTIRYAGRNDFLNAGVDIYVSGWGDTYKNSGVTEYLMYAPLKVISNQECKQHFRPDLIGDGVVCAKGSNGQSSCYGDSGGPVVRYDKDGRYTLVGIVSFSDSKGCVYGYPVGYTRLQHYNDFIITNTGVRPGT